MNVVLLSFVLTSVCLLHTRADIPIQPDFKLEQLFGKWHLIVLAHTLPTDSTAAVLKTFSLAGTDDLNVHVAMLLNGECQSKDYVLTHTHTPGKFTTGESSLYWVEVDQSSYFIIYVTQGSNRFLHLYSKEPRPSEEVKAKFMAQATALGFTQDQITYQPLPDKECP